MLHVVVALAFVFVGCTDSRTGIYPGEKAPDVVGVDLQGSPVSLHSIKGKVILVNFWATWCAPCMAELPALEALYQRLKGQGFQIVGIAVDDAPANIKDAVNQYHISYPIIIDEDAKSKRRFEIKGLPESFVLDSQHKVLIVNDPSDGDPVTKIIGPREWVQNRALQLFQALVQ